MLDDGTYLFDRLLFVAGNGRLGRALLIQSATLPVVIDFVALTLHARHLLLLVQRLCRSVHLARRRGRGSTTAELRVSRRVAPVGVGLA